MQTEFAHVTWKRMVPEALLKLQMSTHAYIKNKVDFT